MRLYGASMVRNEADVIEASVRHNLALLDGLVVVDHGSVDGTSEILAKLQAEGLALRVEAEPEPAFRQSATMTALTRRLLKQDAADYVFALDADEFLKVASRSKLERALAAVPAGAHAILDWLTYVPDAFDATFGPGHLWWRLKSERHGNLKVIVSRALLECPDDTITMGNHCVSTAGEVVRTHVRLRSDVAALAHCPVRSQAQFEGKILINHLAHLATQAVERGVAQHWRDLYAELRAGKSFPEERLREIACNYTLPATRWQAAAATELIEDPVQLSGVQRYRVAVAPTPLQQLLRFAETLIAAEQQRSPAGPRYTKLVSGS